MEKDVANIELPKDVEGREIPLDTTKLFGASGNAYNITRWIYTTDFDTSDSVAGQWRAATDTFERLDPEFMYLTPPDSWEQLFEDLNRAVEANNVCMYFSESGTCLNCAIRNTSGGCSPKALEHILERIRELRGEGQ